jgi:hypothetical protein
MEISERKIYESTLTEQRQSYAGYFDHGVAQYHPYEHMVMHLSLENEQLTVKRYADDEGKISIFSMKELNFIRDFLDEVKK